MTALIRHPRECGDPSCPVILANAGIHPRFLQRQDGAARGLARFE